MQATRNPPALADAADVLSSQLREHLQHLAKFLLPHVGILERRFLLKLRRLRFDAKQRTALAAITPFAASGILAPGRPLSDFFEQVEYNGRRLAKLALPPSRIVEALRESDGLLKPVFGALPEREGAEVLEDGRHHGHAAGQRPCGTDDRELQEIPPAGSTNNGASISRPPARPRTWRRSRTRRRSGRCSRRSSRGFSGGSTMFRGAIASRWDMAPR